MLVSAAAAETVVPPGNGAATQYTEAIPTSGGNAVNGDGINGGHSNPSHVLGQHNAKQLEDEGQVGKETARVAAETAPSQDGSGSGGSGGGHHGAAAGGGGGQNGPSSGSGANIRDNTMGPQGSTTAGAGDGSSGLGEVIGQATGSSSGEAGLLLPLILLVALVGSLAYAWRRRRVAH